MPMTSTDCLTRPFLTHSRYLLPYWASRWLNRDLPPVYSYEPGAVSACPTVW